MKGRAVPRVGGGEGKSANKSSTVGPTRGVAREARRLDWAGGAPTAHRGVQGARGAGAPPPSQLERASGQAYCCTPEEAKEPRATTFSSGLCAATCCCCCFCSCSATARVIMPAGGEGWRWKGGLVSK